MTPVRRLMLQPLTARNLAARHETHSFLAPPGSRNQRANSQRSHDSALLSVITPTQRAESTDAIYASRRQRNLTWVRGLSRSEDGSSIVDSHSAITSKLTEIPLWHERSGGRIKGLEVGQTSGVDVERITAHGYVKGTLSGRIWKYSKASKCVLTSNHNCHIKRLIAKQQRNTNRKYYYLGRTHNGVPHGWGKVFDEHRLLLEGNHLQGELKGWYILYHEYAVEIGCSTPFYDLGLLILNNTGGSAIPFAYCHQTTPAMSTYARCLTDPAVCPVVRPRNGKLVTLHADSLIVVSDGDQLRPPRCHKRRQVQRNFLHARRSNAYLYPKFGSATSHSLQGTTKLNSSKENLWDEKIVLSILTDDNSESIEEGLLVESKSLNEDACRSTILHVPSQDGEYCSEYGDTYGAEEDEDEDISHTTSSSFIYPTNNEDDYLASAVDLATSNRRNSWPQDHNSLWSPYLSGGLLFDEEAMIGRKKVQSTHFDSGVETHNRRIASYGKWGLERFAVKSCGYWDSCQTALFFSAIGLYEFALFCKTHDYAVFDLIRHPARVTAACNQRGNRQTRRQLLMASHTCLCDWLEKAPAFYKEFVLSIIRHLANVSQHMVVMERSWRPPTPCYPLTLSRKLGSGGNAVVYSAVDQNTREIVAVKLFAADPVNARFCPGMSSFSKLAEEDRSAPTVSAERNSQKLGYWVVEALSKTFTKSRHWHISPNKSGLLHSDDLDEVENEQEVNGDAATAAAADCFGGDEQAEGDDDDDEKETIVFTSPQIEHQEWLPQPSKKQPSFRAGIIKGRNRLRQMRDYEEYIYASLPSSSSSHLVQYLGSTEVAGVPGLVLEYCKKGSLHQRLFGRRGSACNVPDIPSWTETIKIYSQLAEGLASLHKFGLVHRDIKSSNFLLAEDGIGKLADFGLTCHTDLDPFFLALYGNVYYAAPEVIRGEGFWPESDVYSFGVSMWETLSRQPAHEEWNKGEVFYHVGAGDHEFRIPPLLAPDMASLLRAMLHRDRRFRPSSAAVAERLKQIMISAVDSVVDTIQSLFGRP